MMDEKEHALRLRLKDQYEFYAAHCLKVRSKSGEIVPFKFNRGQKHIHKLIEDQRRTFGRVRAIILKGRQLGSSTYSCGRFYHQVTHRFGARAFILTHEAEATANLFEITQRYHENCPEFVRPQTEASSAKELLFGELDSGYKIGTAGNKGVGRSSTIQLLLGSEVAFWPNAAEHAKGILQTVPNEPGTEIILESTANGVGNYFHEQWQQAEAGTSDFIPIFVPWFWDDSYKRDATDFIILPHEKELVEYFGLTNEQLAWRRYKILELSANGADGEKSFNQEYPNTAAEAFLAETDKALIPADIVMRARKEKDVQGIGKLIVGVDPARFGDDRTAIIRRTGRKMFGLETYQKRSLMEVVGICYKILTTEPVYKMCIDVAGLGAGVYDRLLELVGKDKLVAVNGGETPLRADRYFNKRAEMWGELKKWLVDAPCSIPDSDELQSDLCAIEYSIDSNSRLVMEKKEHMKGRGLRSPDTGDCAALTFSLPNSMLLGNDSTKNVASEIMSQTKAFADARKKRKW